MASFTYLIINFLTLLVPFIRSFDKRVNMVGKWKALLPAMLLTATLFLVWDVWFTELGVWGFNDRYLSGIHFAGLPLGEYLFFLTVPYACLFVYEVLNYFIKQDLFGQVARPIILVTALVLLLLAWFSRDQWYTGLTFLLTGIWLLVLGVIKPHWLGRFLLSYIVCLLPFLMVNGVLTGSFLEEQVVWYNDQENYGIRIFTIPIEDTVYMLLLLVMNVTFYEALKLRFGLKKPSLNTTLATDSATAG